MNRPMCVGVGLLAVVLLGQMGIANASTVHRDPVSPVLKPLLEFHPSWVTRSVTSHDPWGGNGDGSGDGIAREGEYHVLFHGRGEGRITRIWMTDNYNDAVAHDWKELWIQIDGQTVYRGSAIDFFAGKGPWHAPLVLDFKGSSGGFLSYVPFPYAREAKVLLKGEPHYFQVTYRQGFGSSAGPTADELATFMSEEWWKATFPHRRYSVTSVSSGAPAVLAAGPQLVSGVRIRLEQKADLAHMRIRVAGSDPVPLSFFFGLGTLGDEPLDGGWARIESSIHHVDPPSLTLSTRLPIPLREGESLVLESTDGAEARVGYHVVRGQDTPGVRMMAQFRDQSGPGAETTMPFFESSGPTQFVALIEQILDAKPGDRAYLEGDEMIRTDRMSYPLQLGTGTEDYFNGGWYFLGTHSNPMSGQPRFIVNDPEDGWSHARFDHSVYRDHVADPVVSRSGMRFGMEAGEMGAYTPVRYRTLGLAYAFDRLIEYGRTPVGLSEIRAGGSEGEQTVVSAVDAERNSTSVKFVSRASHGVSTVSLACKSRQEAVGAFIVRSYDAQGGDQGALIRVNGRDAGMLYEAYANPYRRFAQDGLWVDLLPTDCATGAITLEIDSTRSTASWSEAGYEAVFFTATHERAHEHGRSPAELSPPVSQGEPVRVLDTSSIGGVPYYVNDHTLVRGDDGSWHLYGIYHAEPFGTESENQFVHAVHSGTLGYPDGLRFDLNGIALEKRSDLGETHLWAPHAVRDGDRYVMVFQSGGRDNDHAQIRLAESQDLAHWSRVGDQPLFEDVCVARDPMLFKVGDLWTLYYTRCNDISAQRSGVAFRTSSDLIHWSEPSMALVLGDTTPMFNSGYTESPFVFKRGDWYYLSVTSYPVDWDATFVYRSSSPFSFSAHPYARLRAHAAEWLDDGQGGLLMTTAGAGQGGVWMMPVSGF